MPDVPGNTSTDATIALNGTVTGSIEVKEDHDWYKIYLNAGQYTVTLSGAATNEGTLVDPYLNVRNSTGDIVGWNDDSGGNRNAKVVFTVTTSGYYYIDAGAWDRSSDSPTPLPTDPDYDPNYTGTGTYTLRVGPYVPPPLWNYDQIANQLISGYWAADGGQQPRHFDVAQGGTITVNFGTLTAGEKTLANAALTAWSDIIGVTFTPVTTGGQIRFDNSEDPTDGSVAYSEGHFSGTTYTYADVHISKSWFTSYGSSLNSYSFQTYLHEIGHALGLGHAGNYNGDADYVADALYKNDAWSTTVMSYFAQYVDNTYFRDQGFTKQYMLTPMNGDIVAMQQMYGLSTTTRTGDTTYGFNSNAGRDAYNATLFPNVAYTVFDSGGNDTLDYSGFSQSQVISLAAETFSNVGGGVGNVMIARGTLIENAIGGSGSDHINGNAAANRLVGNSGVDYLSGSDGDDFLTGGLGNDELSGGVGRDTFIDTRSSLNTDEIMDFGVGDRIVFADATLSNFTFSLTGNTLNYTGGSLTMYGNVGQSGTLVASAVASGGVQLTFSTLPGAIYAGDFNGDHRDDVLLRNDNGTVTDWLGQVGGTFFSNHAAASYGLDVTWDVAGVGDFNGDTRSDVILRNSSGSVTEWLGQAAGGFSWNAAATYGLDPGWTVAGTGDFNGDNRADVLLRYSNGTIIDWLGQSDGTFFSNHSAATYSLSTGWNVVGTGDFNGDTRDDILLRNASGSITEWLGEANGSFTWNAAATYGLSNNWRVVGVGDFNGDNRADVLLRNTDGTVIDWLGQSNGGFVSNHSIASYALDPAWHVEQVGDYNGDGRDDVLLRNDNGTVTDWLGQSNGGFASNHALATYALSQTWHVDTGSGPLG